MSKVTNSDTLLRPNQFDCALLRVQSSPASAKATSMTRDQVAEGFRRAGTLLAVPCSIVFLLIAFALSHEPNSGVFDSWKFLYLSAIGLPIAWWLARLPFRAIGWVASGFVAPPRDRSQETDNPALRTYTKAMTSLMPLFCYLWWLIVWVSADAGGHYFIGSNWPIVLLARISSGLLAGALSLAVSVVLNLVLGELFVAAWGGLGKSNH